MNTFDSFLNAANGILWHNSVLFVILATGIGFTLWSRFSQFRALTHGVRAIRGRYDQASDPGAINHFQALSAALSATVGLGNIGGVALAITLGGPGAVFWMWVVGFCGMALKTTEVTLAMLYRNIDKPENPHGGTMWVISKVMAERGPGFARLGKFLGGLFCVTLLIMVITGGNMFQSWNVGNITEAYLGIPSVVSGIVLAVLVGLVIIGGIKRIGDVAGVLVPVMIGLYFIGALYVLLMHWRDIPDMFALIFRSAFLPTGSAGAFLGGTAGYAFLYGMKRAIFSNEAGQGTSPIAHSAAKTREPVREGVVAGLEPFIDTIVVCTLTALVIIVTGTWNRGPEARFVEAPSFAEATMDRWELPTLPAPARDAGSWSVGDRVFVIASAHPNPQSGNSLHRLAGAIVAGGPGGALQVSFDAFESPVQPILAEPGIYGSYVGATLTARAFESEMGAAGRWLVIVTVWLFALSTMISYSYYAEQGVVFLAGEGWVGPFKIAYLLLAVVATLGFLETDAQLDNLSGLGTGVMLFVNIPVLWFLGSRAMRAYHDYIRRLDAGEMAERPAAPRLADVISGRDVER